tara:strand:+ start:926 stop:1447 length:522 start_codon:yes stop_codon:yes gene_type:complete
METLNNNRSMNDMSMGPGMYRLEDSLVRNKISYPWAPNVHLQKAGGSVMDKNFIDVESELNNITRPLSNNPGLKYSPLDESKSFGMLKFEDGGPPPEDSTRLTNNAFELKGVGINRFDFLPFDPQKNSIEPFRRIGENTILEVLDKHETECKYDLSEKGEVSSNSKPSNYQSF